jgi:antitoxin MazE
MQTETTVSKWGNSLAVRIPLAIARQAGLSEGDCLALALGSEGGLVLRPTRRRYELSELVARITPKNRHGETDWGQAQGEEFWRELPLYRRPVFLFG